MLCYPLSDIESRHDAKLVVNSGIASSHNGAASDEKAGISMIQNV